MGLFFFLIHQHYCQFSDAKTLQFAYIKSMTVWYELNPAHVHVGVCCVSQLRGGGTGVVTFKIMNWERASTYKEFQNSFTKRLAWRRIPSFRVVAL